MTSKKPLRVLICDDESNAQRDMKKNLQRLLKQDAVVTTFADLAGGSEQEARKRILDQVSILEERRKSARSRSRKRVSRPSDFDGVDILIIDYDLIDVDMSQYLTGEAVSYLVRGYSSCGVIVGLNQFLNRVFDLTLKDKLDSHADLNIGVSYQDAVALWREAAPRGARSEKFRPWAWPILPRQVDNFRRCVEELKSHMNEAILPYLGFDPEIVEALPRSVLEFIDVGDKTQPGNATFEQFLKHTSNGFLTPQDAQNPWQGDLAHERMAVARISKWLEKVVLPEQDILVDAPHLITRFPSLLAGTHSKIRDWDKVASREGSASSGIKHAAIEKHRFPRSHWLSRPAWFWKKIQADTEIDEVRDPWGAKTYDYVFCEDTSRFVKAEAATEFVADLSSPFTRRHVERLSEINYNPGVRFSL